MKFESKYKIFVHINASENAVCKMAAILSRGIWVNRLITKLTDALMNPFPRRQCIKILKPSALRTEHATICCLNEWRRNSLPHTVRCRYNAVNIVKNIHERHPIARPLGRGMGVSFVNPASGSYSARVPVIIYAISYYIGPRYNGTRLC